MKNSLLVIVTILAVTSFVTTLVSFNSKSTPERFFVEYNSGDIAMHAGTGSLPTGFFECNGQAVSRTTYALLFSKIGTTYGSGDGSTTFNVPDMRGRFALGLATSGTGSTMGATGGAIDHVHSVDPPNTTSTTPSNNLNNVTLLALGGAAATNHTHDVNISAFNSASANPPFIAIRFMIKN